MGWGGGCAPKLQSPACSSFPASLERRLTDCCPCSHPPRWRQFKFNNVAPSDVIEFRVFDHNRMMPDSHMVKGRGEGGGGGAGGAGGAGGEGGRGGHSGTPTIHRRLLLPACADLTWSKQVLWNTRQPQSCRTVSFSCARSHGSQRSTKGNGRSPRSVALLLLLLLPVIQRSHAMAISTRDASTSSSVCAQTGLSMLVVGGGGSPAAAAAAGRSGRPMRGIGTGRELVAS